VERQGIVQAPLVKRHVAEVEEAGGRELRGAQFLEGLEQLLEKGTGLLPALPCNRTAGMRRGI